MKTIAIRKKARNEAELDALERYLERSGLQKKLVMRWMEGRKLDLLLSCGCEFSREAGSYLPCPQHRSTVPRTCPCGRCQEMTAMTAHCFKKGCFRTAEYWRQQRRKHFAECWGMEALDDWDTRR